MSLDISSSKISIRTHMISSSVLIHLPSQSLAVSDVKHEAYAVSFGGLTGREERICDHVITS
jgi:hypothetical protein